MVWKWELLMERKPLRVILLVFLPTVWRNHVTGRRRWITWSSFTEKNSLEREMETDFSSKV